MLTHQETLTAHLKRAEFALNSLREYQMDKFAMRYYYGNWRESELADLLADLINAVGELALELRSPWRVEEISAEAADVANYAAIIADVARARLNQK